MTIFTKIRTAVGKFNLDNAIRSLSRKPSYQDFVSSKTFLILFDIDTNEELELIKKYVSFLKQEGKKVMAIGFYDSQLPFLLSYSKIDMEILNRKNLNWYQRPNDPFLRNIAEEVFDVLINLSIRDYFPLKYISALSHSRFKIGAYSKDNERIHDLMIDINEDRQIKFFLKQLNHYLNQIKKVG